MNNYDGYDKSIDNTIEHFELIQQMLDLPEEFKVYDTSYFGAYDACRPDIEIYHKGQLLAYIEAEEQRSENFFPGIPARKIKLKDRPHPETPLIILTFNGDRSLARVISWSKMDIDKYHVHGNIDRYGNQMRFIHPKKEEDEVVGPIGEILSRLRHEIIKKSTNSFL